MKKGTINWTTGKIIQLVLIVVVLALVIVGVSTGGLNPLVERVGGTFDSVLVMFGLKNDEPIKGDCFNQSLDEMPGGHELLEILRVPKDRQGEAKFMVCRKSGKVECGLDFDGEKFFLRDGNLFDGTGTSCEESLIKGDLDDALFYRELFDGFEKRWNMPRRGWKSWAKRKGLKDNYPLPEDFEKRYLTPVFSAYTTYGKVAVYAASGYIVWHEEGKKRYYSFKDNQTVLRSLKGRVGYKLVVENLFKDISFFGVSPRDIFLKPLSFWKVYRYPLRVPPRGTKGKDYLNFLIRDYNQFFLKDSSKILDKVNQDLFKDGNPNDFFKDEVIKTHRGDFFVEFRNLSYDGPEVVFKSKNGQVIYGLDFRPVKDGLREKPLTCTPPARAGTNPFEISKIPFVLVKKEKGTWVLVGERDDYALLDGAIFNYLYGLSKIKEFLRSKC